MYQFFVEPEQIDVAAKSVIIRGTDVNHIKNVLRMAPRRRSGCQQWNRREGISLWDPCTGRGLCPSGASFYQGRRSRASGEDLSVPGTAQGGQDGAHHPEGCGTGTFLIIPVAMKRCVVKLDEKKADSKIKRWQGIAEAAAKQSKRGVIRRWHRL